MAYCLYLRKSRADLEAEAHGEGETLARHEKALLEFAGRQKLNITQIYREIVSGETIASRPIMQQLLCDVEENMWDGVLVMEVERLARGDTIDQGIVAQTFQFSGTKIITPLKTYDPNNEYDEEYFEFGLFMSRREYKTINRRLQRGRIASVKEGKYVGNTAPYGYQRKKIEKGKGYTLISDPDTAAIVRMIFSMYAYGEKNADETAEETGTSKIVRKLNALNLPAMKGKGWSVSTIRGMLRNPVYIGKIRWNARPTKKKMVGGQIVKERPREKPENWILTDGLHEPLIDCQTWNIVQQKLSENSAHPCPKNRTIANPLAGIVVCGNCGRRMVRRPYANRDYPDTIMCPASSCSNISSTLESVEKRILQALKEWLDQYQLDYEGIESTESARETELTKKALHSVQRGLRKLEEQRKHIFELLEQGIYSTAVFLERSKNVDGKIEEAQKSIALLERQIQLASKAEQGPKIVIPNTEKVLAQYGKAKTPAEKNQLLKSVITKVVYTKAVNGRWHNEPDDFELILYRNCPALILTDNNVVRKSWHIWRWSAQSFISSPGT